MSSKSSDEGSRHAALILSLRPKERGIADSGFKDGKSITDDELNDRFPRAQIINPFVVSFPVKMKSVSDRSREGCSNLGKSM